MEDYGYGESAYGAMKAALLFYMKSLSRKVGKKGIRINAVSPGPIYFPGGYWNDVEKNHPEAFRSVVEENAMRRLGKPEEIANVVAFLASRFVLPPIFKSIARLPELVLVGALAWCFAMAGFADALGLSTAMGALIAGNRLMRYPWRME